MLYPKKRIVYGLQHFTRTVTSTSSSSHSAISQSSSAVVESDGKRASRLRVNSAFPLTRDSPHPAQIAFNEVSFSWSSKTNTLHLVFPT